MFPWLGAPDGLDYVPYQLKIQTLKPGERCLEGGWMLVRCILPMLDL